MCSLSNTEDAWPSQEVCNQFLLSGCVSCYKVTKVKAKGKLVPVHNSEWCHQDTSGHAGTNPHKLTSVLDGGEWSASHTSCLTTAERTPNSHQTGGLAHPSCFGDYKEKKNLCPCLELTPISQSSNLLLRHYIDWAMLLIHITVEVKKKNSRG